MESKKCLAAALRLLARRGHFIKELERKLYLKGFSESAIQFALDEAKRFGYLNEIEEKRLYIERGKRKGWGPKLIAHRLKERGLSADPSAIAFDQEKEIMALIHKKYRTLNLSDPQQRAKLFRALQRKGFEEEKIIAIIKICRALPLDLLAKNCTKSR